jgi:hypothetical protein
VDEQTLRCNRLLVHEFVMPATAACSAGRSASNPSALVFVGFVIFVRFVVL